MKKTLTTVCLLLLMSCASRPQLYPNTKYKHVGQKIADKDIDRCMGEADKYVNSSKGKKIAKGAGAGAVIGAAMGGKGAARETKPLSLGRKRPSP